MEFLKSGGNLGKYWEVLDRYKITKERLASFGRKIVSEPYYHGDPALIGAFEEYGRILRSVHAGDDLGETYGHAKGQISDGLRGKMEEVWGNFHDWDALRQIRRVTEVRQGMHPHFVKTPETLFFDNALESYLRQLTERVMHVEIDSKYLFGEIYDILINLAISFPSD